MFKCPVDCFRKLLTSSWAFWKPDTSFVDTKF